METSKLYGLRGGRVSDGAERVGVPVNTYIRSIGEARSRVDGWQRSRLF